MDAFDRLCRSLRTDWPVQRWRDVTVLVAVSGGADSVALVRGLLEIKQSAGGRGKLVVAHFNHAIRGEDAKTDEAFVCHTATQWGLTCEVGRPRTAEATCGNPAVAPDDEATMRASRYAFLAQTAHRIGARYVATGHTQDDNVETMLHHLFRGTGPTGLAGMPQHRELAPDVLLVRPLLKVDRRLVRNSLRAIAQPWREDASNEDVRWKRNWIRTSLLPLIEQEYPGASERIAAALRSQSELIMMLDAQADRWLASRCRLEPDASGVTMPNRARIDCPSPPAPHESPVMIHAFRRLWDRLGWPRGAMRQRHWQRLWQMASDASSSTTSLPGHVQATRGEGQLMLERRDLGRKSDR